MNNEVHVLLRMFHSDVDVMGVFKTREAAESGRDDTHIECDDPTGMITWIECHEVTE